MRRAAPWLVGLGLFVLLGLVLGHVEDIARLLQWLTSLGPLGDALFAGFYLLGTLGMLPASFLEGGAGFVYGPIWGLPVAVGLGALCSTISFLLGRTLFRGAVERRIARNPRFVAIDRAIDADGRRLVFLLRLSPLAPFNALSPVLGATSVSVKDFVIGTVVGHLFPVTVFVYTGSTVASAFDLVQGSAPPTWVTVVGLGLTALATIGVSRFAKRALDGALSAPPG